MTNFDFKKYCEERKYMPKPECVEACKQFIEEFFVPGKKTHNETETYRLKHYVEKHCGFYVAQEDFIQAAIELGYDAIRQPGTKYSIRCNFKFKERFTQWDDFRNRFA